MNVSNERRKHKRVKKEVAVAIHDSESNVISETKNLSLSGVCCHSSKPLAVMGVVEITLLLPVAVKKGQKNTTKVTCQGVVVRCEPLKKEPGVYDIAIYFPELGKTEQRLLETYILESVGEDL